MIKRNLFSLFVSFVLLITLSNCADTQITKPEVFVFGSSMVEMKKNLKGLSESMTERLNEPIQVPTAKKSQSQLDVHGFMYAGKKRKVELIFADDQLDIVWILTEAEEEQVFLEKLTQIFGEPTHEMGGDTFFLHDQVGLRNDPHEVLFFSERLKTPYQHWLDSQKNQ